MYQIDKSFTCLEPQIDFSKVALDQSNQTACVLGDPPQHLRSVHCSALINDWHERLEHAFAHPTQVENRKGHRRVQVLGCSVFDFEESGQVHVWTWTFNDRNLPALQQLPDHLVAAVGVPYQTLWLESYKEGILRSLSAHHPGRSTLCNEYLNWASIGLIKLCWPQEVQDRVRGQIAEVLALDPQVMEIAAQIELSATQRVPTRLAHYNHVQADKLRYLTLAFEAPQFIALYFLLGDKLSSQQEVTYSMKQYLREFGFGAAVWRLLSREGTHWIIEYLAYFDIQRQSLGSCAIEILKMACAFGTHALPPSELLHALIQLGGNPNQPSAYFVTRVDDQFALCRRLGILAQRADASTLQLLKEQAMTIFEWGSDHAQFVPDATLRRISLKGLLRKAEIQALRDKKKRESGPSWKSPFEIDLQDSNVSAVILTSTLAIWQEGQVMHHCADKFGRRCAGGELLMVSLRDARHRHPLATASFSMNKPMVQIHKYSGFANGRISSQTYDLIEQCRQQLQMQRHVQAVELEDFELPA